MTPYYVGGPRDLAPLALLTMARELGYRRAVGTLDGPLHAAASAAVVEGLRDFARAGFDAALRDAVDVETARLVAAVEDGPVDLAGSFRRVSAAVLAASLGLPPEMAAAELAMMDRQVRFLFAHPPPPRAEHRDLARVFRSMMGRCRDLLADYLARDRDGRPVPTDVTAALMRAVRDGRIPHRVGVSTLFGLVNAGEVTTSGTGANLAVAFLRDGTWQALAAAPDRVVAEVARRLPAHSSVHAWQKTATTGGTLAGPRRSATLRKGDRVLVNFGAMHADPARAGRPAVPFSDGVHACPGRSSAHKTLGEFLRAAVRALPDARLAAEPRPVVTIATASYDRVLVTRGW